MTRSSRGRETALGRVDHDAPRFDPRDRGPRDVDRVAVKVPHERLDRKRSLGLLVLLVPAPIRVSESGAERAGAREEAVESERSLVRLLERTVLEQERVVHLSPARSLPIDDFALQQIAQSHYRSSP